MYSDENYLWGLVAYGLGVLLVLPAMFKVTGFCLRWKPLCILARIFFITLLVTPVYAYEDMRFLAPAWIVATFETISTTSSQGPALAYAVLSAVFLGLSLATAAFYLARYFWRRKQRGETPQPRA